MVQGEVKNLTRSVILNPSILLRVNSVKDLIGSFAYAQDRLWLTPQNDTLGEPHTFLFLKGEVLFS